jgi:hypothetical protein
VRRRAWSCDELRVEPRGRQPAEPCRCEAGARGLEADLLGNIAPAARMTALAGDLRGVLVGLAIRAAVLLVSRAGTGGVSALLLISHRFISPSGFQLGNPRSWMQQCILDLAGAESNAPTLDPAREFMP